MNNRRLSKLYRTANALMIWLTLIILTTSCAIKPTLTHQYTLNAFDIPAPHQKTISKHTILLTNPDSAVGYQTTQMFYMIKPHERLPFTENGWATPPAAQLLPLMIQSLTRTQRFRAIISPTTPQTPNYQLDTELIDLYQDFIKLPSTLVLTVKITLSSPDSHQIIASRLFHIRHVCPSDTPYGGVLAANAAVKQLTRGMTRFVLNHIESSAIPG